MSTHILNETIYDVDSLIEELAKTGSDPKLLKEVQNSKLIHSLHTSIATSVQGGLKAALSSDYSTALSSFTSPISDAIGEMLVKDLPSIIPDLTSMSGIFSSFQQAQALASRTSMLNKQFAGLLDMSPTFESYKTQTSSQTTYNNYYNTTLSTNAIIGNGVSFDRLAKELVVYIQKYMKKT